MEILHFALIVLGLVALLSVGGLILVCIRLLNVIKSNQHEPRISAHTVTVNSVSERTPAQHVVITGTNASESIQDHSEAGAADPTPKSEDRPDGGIECGNCGAEITGDPCEVRADESGTHRVFHCKKCNAFVSIPSA